MSPLPIIDADIAIDLMRRKVEIRLFNAVRHESKVA